MDKQNEAATGSNAVDVKQRLPLNSSSKEDYDNAYQFRFELTEWLLDKGITVDTEMLSIFVGWDGGKPAPLYTSRELAVKVLPRDAYMESQYLWDLYSLSESEDEFIEKFKEWRAYLSQRKAVDDAENVAPIVSRQKIWNSLIYKLRETFRLYRLIDVGHTV